MMTRQVGRGHELGFTLIELMIVVLVILILAALLIPQFGLARERALKATCISNQRNLETVVALWHTDHPAQNYTGGPFSASTPSFADLTGATPGATVYTPPQTFLEPDHAVATNGADYYLYDGGSNGGPVSPEYGHVACAYDGVKDPWVDSQNATNANSLDHRRNPSYTP